MSTGQQPPGTPSVDEGVVRRLVAAQFPQWAGLAVRHLPSGGTVNAVYRLGEDMAVRLPFAEDGVADLVREQRWLPLLAPGLPTAIPCVLAAGRPGEGFPRPWSVYRWLPGEHPTAGRPAEPTRLAADLAAFVLAMRALTLPGAPQAHRGGPLALLDVPTRSAIGQLRGMPEEGVDCDAVTGVWERGLRAPAADRPVWLHADLMPGNLLVDGGRLAAVLDFGCAGTGDPACDLFPAWNLLPAGARDAFRDAVRADDATWARGRARTLSQALIALPYYRTTNLSMAANARHVIRAVLADAAA